jgi:hypothetical protein
MKAGLKNVARSTLYELYAHQQHALLNAEFINLEQVN